MTEENLINILVALQAKIAHFKSCKDTANSFLKPHFQAHVDSYQATYDYIQRLPITPEPVESEKEGLYEPKTVISPLGV